MENIYAIFTICFGSVFGIGFIIMALCMEKDKPVSKIPKPSARLNNKFNNYDDNR